MDNLDKCNMQYNIFYHLFNCTNFSVNNVFCRLFLVALFVITPIRGGFAEPGGAVHIYDIGYIYIPNDEPFSKDIIDLKEGTKLYETQDLCAIWEHYVKLAIQSEETGSPSCGGKLWLKYGFSYYKSNSISPECGIDSYNSYTVRKIEKNTKANVLSYRYECGMLFALVKHH